MSRCACSFIRGLKTSLAVSIRTFLGFGCAFVAIYALLVSIIMLRLAYLGFMDHLFQSTFYLQVLEVSIFSLVASLIGIYGACNSNQKVLKVFSAMIILNGLFISGCIMCALYSGNNQRNHEDLYQRLNASRVYYSWDQSEKTSKSERQLVATSEWDGLQTGMSCCGIDYYAEWDQFKPDYIPSKVYPSSCCPRGSNYDDGRIVTSPYVGPLCQEIDPSFYRLSCRQKIVQFETRLIKFACLFYALQLILATLAHCVSKDATASSEKGEPF